MLLLVNVGPELQQSQKGCFMAHKELLPVAKCCTPPHGPLITIWQPICIYDWLPSTPRSCDHHLLSSLMASPENQWGSWQERVKAVTPHKDSFLSALKVG